ncbi:MAG: hypothetical protein DRH08_00695 [Deltaproteobacteria bacterium]|nr:MAG: hypothetical protein DRH08_00695 [Deltaproteobacteria bacterium]
MTQLITKTGLEIDRSSFQAPNRRISVLFLHLRDGNRNIYTVESTGGKALGTNKAPKIPFTEWVTHTISELLAASELRE